MAECALHPQIPVAALVGRRHEYVPRTDKVAVGAVNRPLHGLDCPSWRVVNLDLNRIEREHALQMCKEGTRTITG